MFILIFAENSPIMTRLLLLLTLTFAVFTAQADTEQMLKELDQTIASRGEFIKAKEDKIALLKQQAKAERDSNMLLRLYTDIYTEYHVFKFDSAMCYAEKGYQLALRSTIRTISTVSNYIVQNCYPSAAFTARHSTF